MEKVNRETAEKDVNTWLDSKKVSEKKRETYSEAIETLICAIMDGTLTLRSADNYLIQTLQFPTEGEAPVKVLEFKPRLKVFEIHQQTANEKNADGDTRILAHVAALTGQVKGLIKKLDLEDYNICQSIAIFFL